MKTYLYRASNLKSTIAFLASVSWRKLVSGDLYKPSFLVIYSIIIIILIIDFFRRVFFCSECTEAIATSLIPQETILPEESALSLVLVVLCGLK